MQSEDFDKKIKEAAEHHHPAYDEKAWDKMETLLDKHMPGEKDDRRKFFFFLLFLTVALLSGGVYYLRTNGSRHNTAGLTNNVKKESSQQSPEEKSIAPANTAENKSAQKSNNLSPDQPATGNQIVASDKKNKTELTTPVKESPAANPGIVRPGENRFSAKQQDKPALQNNSTSRLTVAGAQKNKLSPLYSALPVAQKNVKNNRQKTQKTPKETFTEPETTVADHTTTTKANTKEADGSNRINQQKTDAVAATGTAVTGNSAPVNKTAGTAQADTEKNKTAAMPQKPMPKPGKQKKSAFAITFTAMPDLSIIGTSNTGKIKMGYGAGLSYTLNRITLRSGFYVGRKVYTAGPDEYHLKYPWPNNTILDKVDADCKVYEIPVLLSYNFARSKQSNWFFSSGLSTYLMKKEQYGYYYEYTGSSTVYKKTATIHNEYKHFFSIVNLSAGYERKLNNRLSLSAEPYIKVPLDGIGYGKIQLNSAGIAVTLSVKPFAPKK